MQTRTCKTGEKTKKAPKVTPLKIVRRKATLEDLRAAFHTSVVPKTMPFREREHETIARFLREGFETGCSQAMYISGVPGTGKTASTTAVIEELRYEKFDFKYVTVNAMELIEPKKLFVVIHRGLFETPARITAASACKRLNEKFQQRRNGKNQKPVVILIDELDMLCTRRQEILYDVFNWTALEGNRVQVLAISNTLDLPERVMTQKISSRLGTNRLIFQPYTYEQIQAIVTLRLGSRLAPLLHEQALEYVAKKVANISGDLRKVMDFLRRGVEIAMENGESSQVGFEHVQKAQKEASQAVRNVLGEGISRHALLLFQAGLSQIQSSGDEEFRFYELYKHYRLLCTSLEGVEPLHDYACWTLMGQLSSNRLLSVSPGSNLLLRKLRLGMPVYEAQALVNQVRDARLKKRILYN